MTEAIFGLLGVVIGGLLNGGVTWWSERRRDTRDARAAARLIEVELIRMASFIDVATTVGVVGMLQAAIETTTWEESAPTLARLPQRDRQTWGALIAVYTTYEALTRSRPEGEWRRPFTSTERGALEAHRKQITRALDALREITGSPPLAAVPVDVEPGTDARSEPESSETAPDRPGSSPTFTGTAADASPSPEAEHAS